MVGEWCWWGWGTRADVIPANFKLYVMAFRKSSTYSFWIARRRESLKMASGGGAILENPSANLSEERLQKRSFHQRRCSSFLKRILQLFMKLQGRLPQRFKVSIRIRQSPSRMTTQCSSFKHSSTPMMNVWSSSSHLDRSKIHASGDIKGMGLDGWWGSHLSSVHGGCAQFVVYVSLILYILELHQIRWGRGVLYQTVKLMGPRWGV